MGMATANRTSSVGTQKTAAAERSIQNPARRDSPVASRRMPVRVRAKTMARKRYSTVGVRLDIVASLAGAALSNVLH